MDIQKGGRILNSRSPIFFRKRSFWAILVVVIVVCFSYSLSFATSIRQGLSVKLVDAPPWVVSGAWNTESTEFTLVDVVGARLLRYSLEGALVSECRNAKVPLPSLIQRVGDDYVVEAEDGGLAWLDDDCGYKKGIDLKNTFSPNLKAYIRSVYGWTMLRDGVLLFGDLERGEGGWSSAFMYVPLAAPSSFSIVREMAISDPARQFYLLGNPYLASAGGKGYFLVMNETPFVAEFDPSQANKKEGSPPPRAFRLSETFRRRPMLPKKDGLNKAANLFGEIEKSTMITGIYGLDDKLFLAGRIRNPKLAQTQWVLEEIDRKSGKAQPFLNLPTSASHVVLLPSQNRWAVVEKGVVKSAGNQAIESVRFFDVKF